MIELLMIGLLMIELPVLAIVDLTFFTELPQLLIGTVLLRPYVFTFFMAYLFLAITTMGRRRTALFTVVAYLVAFLCEYSSIHNGFPFGLYYYIETTNRQELWIAGVPFMDSLSFTFLSYVSYEMAIFLRSPLIVQPRDVQIVPLHSVRRSWLTTAIAALLMMYLDIVIDPVALQGDRWFLGKIYWYPDGGSYFGVTIANFIGWFIVCLFILRLFLWLEHRFARHLGAVNYHHYPFQGLAPAGLYFGVLIFNVSVTFWIGELTMGWASGFIILLLAVLFSQHLLWWRETPLLAKADQHRRDFPHSYLLSKYRELFVTPKVAK
jgi:uncharacterized membrane protein